jgi:hypothetical protein
VAEKESRKWQEGVRAASRDCPAGVRLVHVGDCEADVYDLFVEAAGTDGAAVLIRARHDRQTETGQRVRATLEAQPVADERDVELGRTPKRVPRTARLELRWAHVTLTPPEHRASEHLPPCAVDAVLVREVAPPDGPEPVEWLLLTTVAVDTLEDAWERVTWYTYRWRIERYHFVLKSGCRIEQRQLRTAERLEVCLALYGLAAVRVLQLIELARETPEAPATTVLSPPEWAVLWAARHPGQPLPDEPPTLRAAVREIARLGGFLGRRGDGEPGVVTVWRGLQRLNDLLQGYYLALQLASPDVGNG